jgi:phosphinothricin acetyltransferase
MQSLEASDFALGRRGGWTIGRVAQHLVDADVAYAKLLAFQTGRKPGALPEGAPEDGPQAASMLTQTQQALEALIDGVDSDTLYRMVAVGHEEYSPLSLIENIAMHDGEHLAQIEDLLRTANTKQRTAKAALRDADVSVRLATEADLEAINDLYNYYIRETPITFDIEEWPIERRREWFAKFAPAGRQRLLIAEDARRIVGFAGTGQFRPKAAYESTVETTIYCAPDATGRGIGRALYTRLFDELRGEDIHSYVAGITLPNDASCRLHERFGFRRIGVFRDVGRKFGRYWDVGWYERLAE